MSGLVKPATLPVKDRYTNADVMAGMRVILVDFAQLHSCLHSVGERVDRVDEKMEDMNGSLSETRERVAEMRGLQEGMSRRLGVSTDPGAHAEGAAPIRPAIFITKSWKSYLTVGGAVFGCMSGLVILYQVLSPTVVAGVVALHKALMAQ